MRMFQWDKNCEQDWWANVLMKGTSPKLRKWSMSICFKVEKVSKSPRCLKEAWCQGRTNHSKYAQCSKLGRAWLLMFGISLMYKRGLRDESQRSVVLKRPNVQSLEVGWCSKFTSRIKFQKRLMLTISTMGIRSKVINECKCSNGERRPNGQCFGMA